MASEAQRAARALVEHRVERFESRHPPAESEARLRDALARARLEGRVLLKPTWSTNEGKAVLDAAFAPPRRVSTILKSLSTALTLLVLATVWAFVAPGVDAATQWLLGLFTFFATLTLPWVFIAMGSSRLAEESRIRRAIRAALMDEEEALPPAKKWEDEE
jgi:hypothetical protein